MSEPWVVNASPVIVLAKAGYLHLLKELPAELLLPEAVVAEILAGPVSDPARRALEEGWAQPLAPATISAELVTWPALASLRALYWSRFSRKVSQAPKCGHFARRF